MIKVETHGRLGNQLFQYAAARSLQMKTGQELLFSFREVVNEADQEGGSGWEDALKYFNVVPYRIYSKRNLLFYHSSPRQIAITLAFYRDYKPFLMRNPYDFVGLYERQVKWAPKLDRAGVHWLRQGYYPFTADYDGNYLMNGGFEAPEYFDDIRDVLLREITVKEPLSREQEEVRNKLKKCNSVCVSIRHFELSDATRENIFNVCTPEYYIKAIRIIKDMVAEPVFYVSSNDQEWVKGNIDFSGAEVIYEKPDELPHNKLEIMRSCRHFIISNSTFSWWAQYLGTFTDKIVISPSRWYNNEFKSPLINKEWILL